MRSESSNKPPLAKQQDSHNNKKQALTLRKVKDKPVPDTGQGPNNDTRKNNNNNNQRDSENKNAQAASTAQQSSPVIKSSPSPLLEDNVREKRLKFIKWGSSSTSSDSDDSVSICLADRERVLPSPLSPLPSITSNQDISSSNSKWLSSVSSKDSKYPWRRPRSELRGEKGLHVRSMSEPTRSTQPEDQIGAASLPKKSVSVANLAQVNESVKASSVIKPLKARKVLEAVKEEDHGKQAEVEVSGRSDIQDGGKITREDKSGGHVKIPSPSLRTCSASDSEIVTSKSNRKAQAQRVNPTAIVSNKQLSSTSRDSSTSLTNVSVSDSENSSTKSSDLKREPLSTKEQRRASNSQFKSPTQEDIYFSATGQNDPDLIGISMPTVKSMIANLNNRLDNLATEHPKLAQQATDLGLTFVPKESGSNSSSRQNSISSSSDTECSVIVSSPETSCNMGSVTSEYKPTKSSAQTAVVINKENNNDSVNNNNNSTTSPGNVKNFTSSNNATTCDNITRNGNNNTQISPAVLAPGSSTTNSSHRRKGSEDSLRGLKSPSPRALSPSSPRCDRKVRFADPPESAVIEIEVLYMFLFIKSILTVYGFGIKKLSQNNHQYGLI